MHIQTFTSHIRANWRSGVTVAFISVPLSIALSIASGAGPVPGIITSVWATLIASIFGSSNFNVVGAAGALTTVLFTATLASPLGLEAGILPLLAITTGAIILTVWALKADRFLYYIPSSVIYGFSAGVAFLIAVSQVFDATGLSSITRTGGLLGDMALFLAHLDSIHAPTLATFVVFLSVIFIWKRTVTFLPAVIPVFIVGIFFGYLEATRFDHGIVSLGDKFGHFSGALFGNVPWHAIPQLFTSFEMILWLFKTAGVIALIAILETLITAKIGDSITKTQSSPLRELFGLGLANIGSGMCGGLPATGVFIRTGANIKAGATHKTSATVAAVLTGLIAIIALPLVSYIPMAIIAALLVNTAIGLIETHKFKEFWIHEKTSFWIALTVIAITIFEDAGIAVVVGALFALLTFADSISHGRFDAIFNFTDGTKLDIRGRKNLHLPHDKQIEILTYSIAGFLGYIDSARHAANLRHASRAKTMTHIIIRLRDLFAMDFEGQTTLKEALIDLHASGKKVYISSANEHIIAHFADLPFFSNPAEKRIFLKTSEAIEAIRGGA